ncbi:cupin-like domain-containing protein [Aurantiacibacter suaedae]|uniref:cupin-like domain-containing protein n=1 Tax=Aurantiacibacter suaedae TaxID=2545755 RepID=UPI0010F8C373|nr:cupin-like domain-containing protein [Aurantiacibacter suaedae]
MTDRSVTATHKVFPPRARANFSASYPEGPHKLEHTLGQHPLLELEALARMAEALPEHSIEYNRGDLPLGVDGKPGATGLSIGETIRNIETANSWAVLKNIEQVPAYAELLNDLLDEIEASIRQRTGKMLKRQGFIFVSSANAVTPYHFDPEHNILLQLRGTKEMTVFPAGDARFAPDEVHEAYHTGGPRELRWNEGFLSASNTFRLARGEAIFVPVMAPHFVRNLNAVSLSLSITWRSDWSFAESDARALNKLLRSMGLRPSAPRRWPAQNRAKSLAWRVLRRMPGIS